MLPVGLGLVRTMAPVLIAAPVSIVAPVISGSTVVGQTLSTTDGSWTGVPSSYAYQWKRDGSNISLATASTYQLVSADSGTTVTCEVTATNGISSTAQVSNGLAITAIGTPVTIWTAIQGSSGTTSTTIVAADIAAGDLILIDAIATNGGLSSVTDSAGITNGLWALANYQVGIVRLAYAYVIAPSLIPAGTSFSMVFSTSVGKVIHAQKVAGVDASTPLDAVSTGTTGTGSAISNEITTTQDGSIIFQLSAVQVDATATITVDADYSNAATGSRTGIGRSTMASRTLALAGVETWNNTNSDAAETWMARSIAFRKA